MRLFTAIQFDDETKASLSRSMDALKARGVTGNFSLRENLHLTVVFIGETTRPASVSAALDRLDARPFPLEMGGLGSFRGGTIWCGVKTSPELSGIYAQLRASLQQEGLQTEERPFSPHLTVCREAQLPAGLTVQSLSPLFPSITAAVGRISLMKSERLRGKLVYTEIHSKKLI